MLAKLWLLMEIVLKLLKLWDAFGDHMDARRKAEAEEKRQRREEAISDIGNAQTEEEFDNAQDRIVDNKP